MTDEIKEKLDAEMMIKWEQYAYRETMKGNKHDIQHINHIIVDDSFSKVYLNNKLSLWVFILCDGAFGFFDGYTWYDFIPRALAECMDRSMINMLECNEFKEVDGRFYIR